MDLTYSDKFKDYIEVQNDVGYPQTIYKFPNGYGASVIDFKHIYFSIEIAVLEFYKKGNWGINYVFSMVLIVLISLILFFLLFGFAPIIAYIVNWIGDVITEAIEWIEDIFRN